jgi:hypothetical protein
VLTIGNIKFEANSSTTQWLSFKEHVQNRSVETFLQADDSGEPCDPKDLIDAWKGDTLFRIVVSSATIGKGLNLDVITLPTTLKIAKSKAFIDSPSCPGSLVYCIPADTEFIDSSQIRGPRPQFFAESQDSINKILETDPDMLVETLNSLMKKFPSREFLESTTAEKQFLKNIRPAKVDYPLFAGSSDRSGEEPPAKRAKKKKPATGSSFRLYQSL